MRIEDYFRSMLDIDMYKLTMSQHAYKYRPDAEVKFKFINRTDYNIPEYVDLWRIESLLNRIKAWKGFSDEDIDYIRSLGIFEKDYLDYLSDATLPPIEVDSDENNRLHIETEGKWPIVTFWETIVLSVVNQLFAESVIESDEDYYDNYGIGYNNLCDKINYLNRKVKNQYNIVEFGTRRRHSASWQEYVINKLKDLDSQGFNFIGTSNLHYARKHDLTPKGTFAHEMPMVYSGLAQEVGEEAMRESQNKFLDDWYELYGNELDIALSDTFGSEFFFNTIGKERAEKYDALRHDSGSPFEFGDRAIEFYREMGIDPKKKTIIFSDGLDAVKIKEIKDYFKDRIQTGFGWGTKLTNDLNVPKLSIVMKSVEVNGNGLVKLSDNLAKATGKEEDIEFYKEVFNHNVTKNETLDV